MRNLDYNMFFIIFITGLAAEEAFGPYKFRINNVQSCRGPKKRDCAKIKYDLSHDRTAVQVHINVVEEVTIQETRLIITQTGKKNSHPIINLHMRKPCDQIMFRTFIRQLTDITFCRIRKGLYNLTVNINEVMEKMWAGTFFYGNLTTKVITHGDKCNVDCHILDVAYTRTN